MNYCLPEGMGLRRGGFTTEQLRRASYDGTILQATALLATQEHDLFVDLGCCTGRIPKEETSLGADDGSVRDIAILSRVGRPVSFQVLDVPICGMPLLSRRSAQEKAKSFLFQNKKPGDILPAVVTNPAQFGAFCDLGCGIPALLSNRDISVSRIYHSRDRFQEDQQIFAVIKAMDPETGRIQLTHRELLGTWAENAEKFRAGQTVTGIVRGVKDYGAFVELTPNLSGLAEPNFSLHPGDAVSVYIKSILPEQLKIKLVALRKLDPSALPHQPLPYFRTAGHLDRWQYGSETCVKAVTVF